MVEEDLLAAIAADPDDEAARSVYADLLLERDDPRGELIRLERELAIGDVRAPRRGEMIDRVKKLRAMCAVSIVGSLGQIRHAIRQGFVDEVGLTLPALEKRGAELFAAFPIRRVQVELKNQRELLRLAKIAIPARIEVAIVTKPIVLLDVRMLAPIVADRAKLTIHGATQNREQWEALLGDARALRSLSMTGADPRSIVPIVAWTKLETLELGFEAVDVKLSVEHRAALRACGAHVTTFRSRLWMDRADFVDALREYLTDAKPVHLGSFEHRPNDLVDVLAAHAHPIRTLELASVAPHALAAAVKLPGLETLDLGHMAVDDPGAYADAFRDAPPITVHWPNCPRAVALAAPHVAFVMRDAGYLRVT